MTTARIKPKDLMFPNAITCELCNQNFVDEPSFDAHQRSISDRTQPSNAFISMPRLAKCMTQEALWAIGGWRREGRSEKVWIKPAAPKRRAHKVNSDDTYVCLFCKKQFKDAQPFMAHFVHTWTPLERCLDRDEMTALDYAVSPNGVWRATPFTQLMPSQVNRLPTVRAELAELAKDESDAELTGLKEVAA